MYKCTGGKPPVPYCEDAHRNKNPSGNRHRAAIGGPSFGAGRRQMSDRFEVKHQDPPTESNPVAQHKNFAKGE